MAFSKISEEEGDNLLRLLHMSDENMECINVVEHQLELLKMSENDLDLDNSGTYPGTEDHDTEQQSSLPSYIWDRLTSGVNSVKSYTFSSNLFFDNG
mmetsp:Transcript_40657/g.53537  ORF Transcript_40657/g.53537 Transcript_40657/m.53537 type:complete len:97 (+) Transcript_40657:1-291(+)